MLELANTLHQRGRSVAGWRGAEAVSCEALLARAAAWRALALRTPGSDCALYLSDSLEFCAALLGAWAAGKTVWLSADTLDATCTSMARSVQAFFGDFPASCAPRMPQADDACALAWPPLEAERVALVVHTSGSTGEPQAIPKKLAQMASEVATLERVFGAGIGQADVIATVSHQHIYGLLFKILWPLTAGRPIVAETLVYPEQMIDALARRACLLVASPAHLKRLPGHLDWRGAAAQLRAVFSSGGPLAPEAASASERLLGRAPAEIYGSSETGGIGWRRRQAGANSAWEPFPGLSWRIADCGRLEVRSPCLFDDNWLRLEDRANALGPTGFMLLGRGDRLVKLEEKRISLDAVEAALMDSGLAAEARVIVCPIEGSARQALAAFVVPSEQGAALLERDGKRGLNARLRAHLLGRVEGVAMPRRWRYLDQLPADAQGKVTQALLLAEMKAPPAPRLPVATLREQDTQRVLLDLFVPATLFYFDGHFAQAPILPGVAQIDWAIHFGRAHFALPPAFCAIHALKFQQVIAPEARIQLELQHDSAAGSLQFRYFSEAGQHAGGRILFAPSPKTAC